MRILLTLTLFILAAQFSFGQVDNTTRNKIKAYFLTAEELYKNGEYSKSLDKIIEIESLTNGIKLTTTQNLKIKALIGKGSFQKAKNELDLLYSLNPSDDIFKDIAKYSSDIDAGLDAEKKAEVRELLKVFDSNSNITLIAQKQNDKWGFVNKSNEFVIPPKYDWASNMKSEIAVIKLNNKYGVINKTEEIIIPMVYESIDNKWISLIIPFKDNKHYFFNKSGEPLLIDGCYAYNNLGYGLYFCNTIQGNKNEGTLLSDGNDVQVFEDVTSLETFISFDGKRHHRVVYKDRTTSLIDQEGNVLIEPTKKEVSPLSWTNKTNFFKIQDIDEKLDEEIYRTAFYNVNTKQTVTYFYNASKEFSNMVNLNPEKSVDILRIYENGKQGFITNKTIVIPKFESVDFAAGSNRIMVTGGNGKGIVEETGIIFIPLKYRQIKFNKKNGNIQQWYGLKEDGKADVYDVNGKFRGSATLRNK